MAAAAEAAAAAEVAAAAGVMAAAAEVAAAAGVMAARPAVARLMAALAMAVRVVAARVATAEAVGAAAAAAVALVYGLAAAGAAPETTQTAGNGIQLRASGSPSAINGKSGRFRGWPRKFAERYDEVRPELQPYRCSNSGSLAKFAAMRRASSRVSSFAAERRPGSSSK